MTHSPEPGTAVTRDAGSFLLGALVLLTLHTDLLSNYLEPAGRDRKGALAHRLAAGVIRLQTRLMQRLPQCARALRS